MPVALPSVIDTAVPDPDLEVIMLFCLAGLTVSSFLGHLLSVAAVEAALLLACAGYPRSVAGEEARPCARAEFEQQIGEISRGRGRGRRGAGGGDGVSRA